MGNSANEVGEATDAVRGREANETSDPGLRPYAFEMSLISKARKDSAQLVQIKPFRHGQRI